MKMMRWMLAGMMVIVVMASVMVTAAEKSPAASSKVLTVYMIGDSTMANKPGSAKDNPERGWGQTFDRFFKPGIVVDNRALNGRSSKSFRDEGRWKPIEEKLQPGDIVIIQFGHNDEKTDAARHTDPFTTFKASLARYVNETRAKGATPILATPIARRAFDAKTGELRDTHGDYPEAVRQVAREQKVTLLDLNVATTAFLKKLGPEPSKKLFVWVKPGEYRMEPKGRQDNTHLTEAGAMEVGGLAAAQLQAAGDPLARMLKE